MQFFCLCLQRKKLCRIQWRHGTLAEQCTNQDQVLWTELKILLNNKGKPQFSKIKLLSWCYCQNYNISVHYAYQHVLCCVHASQHCQEKHADGETCGCQPLYVHAARDEVSCRLLQLHWHKQPRKSSDPQTRRPCLRQEPVSNDPAICKTNLINLSIKEWTKLKQPIFLIHWLWYDLTVSFVLCLLAVVQLWCKKSYISMSSTWCSCMWSTLIATTYCI